MTIDNVILFWVVWVKTSKCRYISICREYALGPFYKGFLCSWNKYCRNTHSSNLQVRSPPGLNFASAVAAQLSYHMQNCCLAGSHLKQKVPNDTFWILLWSLILILRAHLRVFPQTTMIDYKRLLHKCRLVSTNQWAVRTHSTTVFRTANRKCCQSRPYRQTDSIHWHTK